ncbi:unnamed protein product, partial [Choristocarpus tenellus]
GWGGHRRREEALLPRVVPVAAEKKENSGNGSSGGVSDADTAPLASGSLEQVKIRVPSVGSGLGNECTVDREEGSSKNKKRKKKRIRDGDENKETGGGGGRWRMRVKVEFLTVCKTMTTGKEDKEGPRECWWGQGLCISPCFVRSQCLKSIVVSRDSSISIGSII